MRIKVPHDLLPGANRDTVGLMLYLREGIKEYTKNYPMTAEETIAALCFMAGSASAQRSAHSAHSVKALRDIAIDNIDRGIRSATEADNGGALVSQLEGNQLDG